MTDDTDRGPFDIQPGETWSGRARAASDAEGRPSRRFLEAAAADILHGLPDAIATGRLAAAIAEAHENSVPTGGMAVTTTRCGDAPVLVGRVALENAGSSTHVVLEMTHRHLEPQAAMELAAALVVHAAAARAARDLDRGFPGVASVDDARGPAREPKG